MSTGSEIFMTWEDELLTELAPWIALGTVVVRPRSDDVFTRLQEVFPVGGSQIDWQEVPNAVRRRVSRRENEVAESLAFVGDLETTFKLDGACVIVSDNGFDVALQLPFSALKDALPFVLSIPQHHYVVADCFSWCMCFSMEGNMDFGWRPQ